MSLSVYSDTYRSSAAIPATPVTLLHGWGADSLVWDAVVPLLLQERDVTVIDLPGMGRSPLPSGEYTLDYLAEKVSAVVPERSVLVGWSLGGLVAARMAAVIPDRIAALVMVACNARFCATEDWPSAMQADVLQHFQRFFAEDWEGTLIRFLALQCKGADTMKDDIRFMKERLFFNGLPASRALREGLDLLAQADVRPDLARLSMPVLAVFGEHDAFVPKAAAGAVAALSSHVDSVVISGVAHAPFVSRPPEFVQSLNTFLARHGL